MTAGSTTFLGFRSAGTAETPGVWAHGGTVVLSDCDIEGATHAINTSTTTEASTIEVRHSRLDGPEGFHGNANYSVKFRLSDFLNGGVNANGATVSCAGLVSPAGFHTTSCP